MNGIEKEQVLHKVVAASAFLFALCVLPVAQYYLVTNKLEGKSESGQVAGASTDQSITRSSVASTSGSTETGDPVAACDKSYPQLSCEERRSKCLDDLDRFLTGKKQSIISGYESLTVVKQYRAALEDIQKNNPSDTTNIEALNKLIDGEYQPYVKKLSDVESAVESQKKLLEARSCSESSVK